MVVVLSILRGQAGKKIQYLAPSAVLIALAYQSFLASMQLPAGFRGDIDRLDWLKSLPIHPAAVTFGQISGPALLLSLMQATMNRESVRSNHKNPCSCRSGTLAMKSS